MCSLIGLLLIWLLGKDFGMLKEPSKVYESQVYDFDGDYLYLHMMRFFFHYETSYENEFLSFSYSHQHYFNLSKMQFPLYVCQILNHGCINLVMIFLCFYYPTILCSLTSNFNPYAPHGIYNIWRILFISMSIKFHLYNKNVHIITHVI